MTCSAMASLHMWRNCLLGVKNYGGLTNSVIESVTLFKLIYPRAI